MINLQQIIFCSLFGLFGLVGLFSLQVYSGPVSNTIKTHSSFEYYLMKDEEVVHDFSKTDLDAYNTIEFEINYSQDFGFDQHSRNMSLDLSAVNFSADSSSNITALLNLTHGRYTLEERKYPAASSFTDTSNVFFPRSYFNDDGQRIELDIASGSVTIESLNSEQISGTFDLAIQNNAEFDALRGSFLKRFKPHN